MKFSNLKIPFEPGFSIGKKILTLVVLFSFLGFFSLVYAGESRSYNAPIPGEHPWDELSSQSDHLAPKPPQIGEMLVLPLGGFNRWIEIRPVHIKNGNSKGNQVQINSSDKNRSQIFIFSSDASK
jgi:hypothetical protein